MKMLRLSAFVLVMICCGASVLAQNPPQIVNSSVSFDTTENARETILVDLSDPDPDETLTVSFSLVNGSALGITQAQLQFSYTSKSFSFSEGTVANSFSVPAGTSGKTIEILVQVSDKNNETASRTFSYQVTGANQPPTISLTVRQPGSTAAGTQEDPFGFGTLEYSLKIQDDAGVDDYTYGLQLVSGSFCINYPFQWFGREGLTPTVDVPPVATLTRLEASATVIDGIYTETVYKTVWVEPAEGGCNTGGGGGSTPNPLDSVTAVATPNPVVPGGVISLLGSMTGDTSPWAARWYLGTTTSGEQLIANGWQAQYQAPNYATTLNFMLKVDEISGTRATVKNVPVVVSSSGGTSTKPPEPTPPNFPCSSGLPPTVQASSASETVLGGQPLALSGGVGDPNYPPGTVAPPPTVIWKIEDAGGLAGLSIVNPTQVKAQLTTAAVSIDKWILLSLKAKNTSNGCEALDYLQVHVTSGQSPGGHGTGALMQYAWPGQGYQDATGSTIAGSVAIPFQLKLKANPTGFTSPTFKWQTNRSDGTFSPSDTAQEPTLLVTGESGESAISLSVTLTVAEAGDPSTSEQATANFQLIVTGSSSAPTNVDFIMSEESAEPGTLVTLEGFAESASGLDSQSIEYAWAVVTQDGQPVDVLTSHNRAIFEVPSATETSSAVNVTLVAGENGVPSAPVSKPLQIVSPTLRFAHFGAGPTGGQKLEVQLILVNDSDESVDGTGTLWFVKQDGTANSVLVDDELVEDGSLGFSIEAESSRIFRIDTPDDELRVGWMAVSSPVPLEGIILFQYINPDNGLLKTETALFASQTGRRGAIAVNGRAGSIGFAIANPSAESSVDLIISIPVEGAALEVPMTLQPLEQRAQFLHQLHELIGANMKLSGTLSMEVQNGGGNVVATVLRLSNAGLSTMPVAVRSQ